MRDATETVKHHETGRRNSFPFILQCNSVWPKYPQKPRLCQPDTNFLSELHPTLEDALRQLSLQTGEPESKFDVADSGLAYSTCDMRYSKLSERRLISAMAILESLASSQGPGWVVPLEVSVQSVRHLNVQNRSFA